MNATPSNRSMVRNCVLTVLCMALSAMLMYSTSYAKECEPGNCNAVKVLNPTDQKQTIRFLLCCDGELRKSDCHVVPPGSSEIVFPEGCTVLQAGFCPTLSSAFPRRLCVKFYDDECVVRIVPCFGTNESDDFN